jgi:hypothetical protein
MSAVLDIQPDDLYQLTMQLPDGSLHVVGSFREALPLASQCDPILLQQQQKQQEQQQWSGAGLLSSDAADHSGLGGISGGSSDGWSSSSSSSSSSSNDVTSSSRSRGGWRWGSRDPAPVPLAAALARAERVADGLVNNGAAFLNRGHIVRLCSMTGGWRVPLKSCVAHPCMPAGK